MSNDDSQVNAAPSASRCYAGLAVWSVDDEVWIVAKSEQEALSIAESESDVSPSDVDHCRRLTLDELATMRYFDDIYERTGERSFLEQVGKLVIDGEWNPGIFALRD